MESYRWGGLASSKGLSTFQHLDLGVFRYLHINQSNSSSSCFPTRSIHTRGIWLRDNPLNYSVDLLLFQLSIISIVSCALYALLKPLGHPAIVHQILAGVILGRSVLCQNKEFADTVFPERGAVLIETMSLFGFMYNVFLIGVRTDASVLFDSGKRAIVIGMFGYFCPFLFGSLAANFVEQYTDMEKVSQVLGMIVGTQSMSSFAVISYFLGDLKILNSELGRLASASAIISDICSLGVFAIFRLAFIAKSGTGHVARTIAAAAFLWIVGFGLIWVAAIWVIKRTPPGKSVKETHLFCFVAAVLVCTYFSEVTGQGYVLAPFLVGLAIPAGPPLGSALEERYSSFVALVLMPIFFTTCGLKTNLFALEGKLWGIHLVILICFVVKTIAVMLPSLYCKMPVRDSLALGLIMNCKGIIELSLYNTWLEDKIFSRKVFSALILSLLLLTVTVSSLVQTLYNPARRYIPYRRRTIQHAKRNTELGIITCVHSEYNVPNIIQLLDISNPNKENPFHICVVHLVELVSRASALLITHKREGKASSRTKQSEHIAKAFRHYEESRQGAVWVDIFTSVSPSATMHDDVCLLALEKRASLIILPFHKQWVAEGVSDSSYEVRNFNYNVIEKAPCSLGILISPAHLSSSQSLLPRKQMLWVAVLFLGGADDRESLSYGMRMVEQHNVKLTLIRFTSKEEAYKDYRMKILDSEILNEFKNKTLHNDRVWHKEEIVADGPGVAGVIRSVETGYDLVIVGRRHVESPLTLGLTEWTEHPELGTIGDILATSDSVGMPSVLVVQQQARLWGRQNSAL